MFVFDTSLIPSYTSKLVSLLDRDAIGDREISVLLYTEGTSLKIYFDTKRTSSAATHTFQKFRIGEQFEETAEDFIIHDLQLLIKSNYPSACNGSCARDGFYFHYNTYKTIDWSGRYFSVLSKDWVTLDSTFFKITWPKSNDVVVLTAFEIFFDGSPVKRLVMGNQRFPEYPNNAYQDGKFASRYHYYRYINTGDDVNATLYRCAAFGDVKIQLKLVINGQSSNGTEFPHTFINNGFEKDLFVLKRHGEDVISDVKCRFYYKKGTDQVFSLKEESPKERRQ